MRKMRIRILLLVFDVLIGVSLVLGVWGYNYLIPRAEATGEYSVDGEAIQNPWQQTYAEIEEKTGFTPESHRLIVYGLCSECFKAQQKENAV